MDSEKLAIQYSSFIKAWLKEDELNECCDKNKMTEYADSDAAHDYCDANEAMHDAYHEVFSKEPDLSNQEILDLMGEAFKIAKENDYFPD